VQQQRGGSELFADRRGADPGQPSRLDAAARGAVRHSLCRPPCSPGAPRRSPTAPNTIVVSSVELVLREVELKRVEQTDCRSGPVVVTTGATDEAEANDADAEHEVDEPDEACDELQAGPVLVDLPLGAVERMFTAAVPAGTYDELKFQIHKLETDGDAADRDFLAAHPDLAGISIA